MTYRNPAFMVYHQPAELIDAGVFPTAKYDAPTNSVISRLADYRVGLLYSQLVSQTDHEIAGVATDPALARQPLNRLVIPIGHNFDGVVSVEVFTGAAAPAATSRGSVVPAVGALVDLALTESEQDHYRVVFTGAGVWAMPELWLGRYRQTTTGIAQAWTDPPEAQIVEEKFPSRDVVTLLGPNRRRWTLEHVNLSGADLAIYDAVLASGRSRPFYFWPPDDATPGPFLVRLIEDAEREQDSPAPKSTGPRYTVRLTMREHRA